MTEWRPAWVVVALAAAALSSCSGATAPSAGGTRPLTIGVAFETLQTEYWVASFEAIRSNLDGRGIRVLEAIADGDANRQFEQVRTFIARGVDGIIIAPKDAKTVIPMIKAANRAHIPIVLYNRPPSRTQARAVTVVADNFVIARETVAYLAARARQRGGRHKAMILIGNLSDGNAVERRRGFDAALKDHADAIEVVAEIPTEWNQEKALAGAVNALQQNPDIDLAFTSSDFLFPALISALRQAGKYRKVGEAGHVLLGGFDGDATAYRMLRDGYLDADGVQDMAFESELSVRAVLDLRAGRPVPALLRDPGFVIHQGNLDALAPRMWGAGVAESQR
ncbi:MAG TPA: sugar ABC transporter substrate-binding protein [Isosphaeraceae bacterium]